MSEKQKKRLRRLDRLVASDGKEILLEAHRRFGGDVNATAKWLATTMRQVAINPMVKMRDLLPALDCGEEQRQSHDLGPI